jgi:hypothetical protein
MIDEVYDFIFFRTIFISRGENNICTSALLDMLLKIREISFATRVMIERIKANFIIPQTLW